MWTASGSSRPPGDLRRDPVLLSEGARTRLDRAALEIIALGGCERTRDCATPTADAGMGPIVLGELVGDVFVPLVDEGDGQLVFGPQGGWMLELYAQVPSEWLGESCLFLNVGMRYESSTTFFDPLTLRQAPHVVAGSDGDVVVVGPLPVLLGFEPRLLVDRRVVVEAHGSTRLGRASGRVVVTTRMC